LEQALWSLPFSFGISWKLGDVEAKHAIFSVCASVPIQDKIDRMFWWAGQTRLLPYVSQVPPVMVELVSSHPSRLYPSVGFVPQYINATTVRIRTNMDRSLLTTARSDPTMASQTCDCHFVTPERAVVPVRITIGNCIEDEEVDKDSEEPIIYLTCPCVFLALEQASPATHVSVWKDFTAALPEI